jgi:bifunctional DNA-binding transcriptional regulator/antitoxin component of YhaV-PrlF toxin-antitoxin module
MTKTATFVGTIIKRRLTVPIDVCERLRIWENDEVKVTIEKIEGNDDESEERCF